MNLEKLVADRELCEQIPADDFLDAAFCWHYTEVAGFVCRTSGCEQFSGKQWMLERSTSGKIIRLRERGEQIYPAPLFDEIVQKLAVCSAFVSCSTAINGYEVDCIKGQDNPAARGNNPSTAALKLWLEMNKK